MPQTGVRVQLAGSTGPPAIIALPITASFDDFRAAVRKAFEQPLGNKVRAAPNIEEPYCLGDAEKFHMDTERHLCDSNVNKEKMS